MSGTGTLRAWAELLRLPAVLTVPGDALAGAAATGRRPGGRTALAVGASLCLYEAGMALNDWADREEDAVARPHRPLPSGRIRPGHALAAAGALTAAGLALAARADRRTLNVAVPLAASVWAYDLKLKHTPAGPAAMAAARFLDLLMGAAATGGPARPALAPAAVLGGHTYAVTLVSRREAEGGSTAAPLAALAATGAVSAALAGRTLLPPGPRAAGPADLVRAATATAYAATVARPLAHAALNPSPALTQRAVGAGIRAVIALQSALIARAGAPATGALTATLTPLAARAAKKVSTT
ncbi:SCO3242 family prenyltransferase [Actinacidiphila acididurans]|uniref:UbiA family prenyltransferase n=1 Tax=Actinacidiphila acididurans TaxID=2784346 RepID=A0ABS2TU12_9ACTN|nr:UbiA family prenyltransferase [Actinacidiphila acididurans]MBM9506476.1 UbiA family prenyltransferase [Actinacidiphila acididurans]